MSFKSFPKENNIESRDSIETRNQDFTETRLKNETFVFFETARYPGKRNETRFDRRNVIIRISLIRVTSSSSRRIFHKSRMPVCAFRRGKKRKKRGEKKKEKKGARKKVEAKSRRRRGEEEGKKRK